jgi:hypothetical protein
MQKNQAFYAWPFLNSQVGRKSPVVNQDPGQMNKLIFVVSQFLVSKERPVLFVRIAQNELRA